MAAICIAGVREFECLLMALSGRVRDAPSRNCDALSHAK